MIGFLKPNKWKIAIFVLLGITVYLGFVIGWGFCKECNPKPFLYDYIPFPISILFWLAAIVILFPISRLNLDFEILFGIISAIYLYFLSCFIVWAVNKISNIKDPTKHTMSENKRKFNAKTAAILLIILLFAWAPWLDNKIIHDDVLKTRGKIDGTIDKNGNLVCDYDVWWFPFGRSVASCEGGYYVTFYGQVL